MFVTATTLLQKNTRSLSMVRVIRYITHYYSFVRAQMETGRRRHDSAISRCHTTPAALVSISTRCIKKATSALLEWCKKSWSLWYCHDLRPWMFFRELNLDCMSTYWKSASLSLYTCVISTAMTVATRLLSFISKATSPKCAPSSKWQTLEMKW